MNWNLCSTDWQIPLLYVPIPKAVCRTHELTRDERLRVQILFSDSHFTVSQIASQTGHTSRQIRYALVNRFTPQKQKNGQRAFLTIPQKKRLIEWVSASRENREIPWIEIPSILGLDCGEKDIRTALKKEGYARRVSRRKPPLSDEYRKKRLDWAQEHVGWSDEHWDKILWSDEYYNKTLLLYCHNNK